MVRNGPFQRDIVRFRGQTGLEGVALLEEDVRVALALLASTFQHLQREIDARYPCGSHLGKSSTIESTTTTNINYLLALNHDNILYHLLPGKIHLTMGIGIAIFGGMKINRHTHSILCLLNIPTYLALSNYKPFPLKSIFPVPYKID